MSISRPYTFSTDLNCQSCVASVTPALNAARDSHVIESWAVDTDDDRKPLTVHANGSITLDQVNRWLEPAGFHAESAISYQDAALVSLPAESASWFSTYRPLVLVFAYIIALSLLPVLRGQVFQSMEWMSDFMGAFFIAFSFFKLLNLKGFAQAYQTYDWVAKKVPAYGMIYPFLELGLGLLFLTRWNPIATNSMTLVVMGVSSLGVAQSLLKKQTIQCACLGTIFSLPMSKVTLVEDLLMVVMSAWMLQHLLA